MVIILLIQGYTSAIMNLSIVSQPETAIAWPKVLISKGPVASVDVAKPVRFSQRRCFLTNQRIGE
jgi:hypothetical protein